MSDSQRPIPPTPGYHSAPGTPPEHRATPGVPATPKMEYLRSQLRRKMAVIKRLPANRLVLRR